MAQQQNPYYVNRFLSTIWNLCTTATNDQQQQQSDATKTAQAAQSSICNFSQGMYL